MIVIKPKYTKKAPHGRAIASKRGAAMGKERKRRFGDRREGWRLRTLDPYNELAPFIMKTRGDASNYFSDFVEITETERYLRDKRKNGYPGMGILHLFIASYIRTLSQYPAANRFVSGQRIYARKNIELVMTVKKELRTNASETSIKVELTPYDTMFDVYHKIGEEIEKVKREGEATSTDNAARAFMKIPRIILKLTISFMGLLDYFGLIPRQLMKASPFHGSVIITDLGSIGLQAIHHHLYNFGNLPVFVAIGPKRKSRELSADGQIVERKYIDYKIVADERICDGFYYAQALRLFKSYLCKPNVLDEPPLTVVEDID